MAYVTRATTKGGRDGRAVLEDGKLALAMALPKDMGGSGEGHNPEQLFALGWSSCFGQAILLLAKKHGLDGSGCQGDVRHRNRQGRDELRAQSRYQPFQFRVPTKRRSKRLPMMPIRSAPIQRRRATTSP